MSKGSKSKAGAKNVYDTKIKPNLHLIKLWKMKGLTDKEIYKNLDISHESFYRYLRIHCEFSEIILKGKQNLEAELISSLFKIAHGHREKIERQKYDSASGTMIKYQDELYFPPNLSAIERALVIVNRADYRNKDNQEKLELERKKVELLEQQLTAGKDDKDDGYDDGKEKTTLESLQKADQIVLNKILENDSLELGE